MFETMLHGETRIRGGVAYGEAYIDVKESIYVGEPIIEAYNLEAAQEWAGIALAPSACERIPEFARTGKYGDWVVVPWDVPLKNDETLQTLAINWNEGLHHVDWRMRWSKEHEYPDDEALRSNASVSRKFLNTKQFHEAFRRDCGAQDLPDHQP